MEATALTLGIRYMGTFQGYYGIYILINPRCMHHRVTVIMCVSVCYHESCYIPRSYVEGMVSGHMGFFMVFCGLVWCHVDLAETLCSKVLVSFADHHCLLTSWRSLDGQKRLTSFQHEEYAHLAIASINDWLVTGNSQLVTKLLYSSIIGFSCWSGFHGRAVHYVTVHSCGFSVVYARCYKATNLLLAFTAFCLQTLIDGG